MMKRWIVLVGLASFFLGGTICASATTYYISWTNGSNTNSGTSKSAPWKCHPWMTGSGCGTPHSYTHAAGDRFIFEGGDTWPRSAFPLVVTAGGSSGNSDYYGVDKTWYIGSAWTRPIFDAQGGVISTSDNAFINFYTNTISYATVDDIEFKGFYWDSTTRWEVGAVSVRGPSDYGGPTSGSQYIVVENCYAHGWGHAAYDSSGPPQQDANQIFGGCWTGCELKDNMVNGADDSDNPTVTGVSSMQFGTAQTVDGNVIENVSNGIVAHAEYVYGNVIEHLRNSYDPTEHSNSIEVWPGSYDGLVGSWPPNLYVYDNVMHDDQSSRVIFDVGTNACDGTQSYIYVYNNVWWNTHQIPILDFRNGNCSSVSSPNYGNRHFVLYNNTYVRGYSGRDDCWEQLGNTVNASGSSIDATNNACINSGGAYTFYDDGINVTPSLTTDLSMTSSTATSDGYTISNAFRPTSGTSPTVGYGTNLTSDCSGTGLTDLCSDANGVWNTGGTNVGSGTNNSRPSSGAWDVGAYMYGSGSINSGAATPAPPTGLQAVVR